MDKVRKNDSLVRKDWFPENWSWPQISKYRLQWKGKGGKKEILVKSTELLSINFTYKSVSTCSWRYFFVQLHFTFSVLQIMIKIMFWHTCCVLGLFFFPTPIMFKLVLLLATQGCCTENHGIPDQEDCSDYNIFPNYLLLKWNHFSYSVPKQTIEMDNEVFVIMSLF